MLVKVEYSGLVSEWTELTEEFLNLMEARRPDVVIVRIEDLYVGSPDAGSFVKLDFEVFITLVKDFVRDEIRQEKSKKRHWDDRSLEDIDAAGLLGNCVDIETEQRFREICSLVDHAKETMTPVQRRRFEFYADSGLSFRKIASIEGVHNTAVAESIRAARRKIKKLLD